MELVARILSRFNAKPHEKTEIDISYRPHVDELGVIEFDPDDVENPRNWSTARKWYYTVLVISLAVNATFASSGVSANLGSISEEFQASIELTKLIITLFLLGFAAGPLIFAPLSEYYGRRWILLWTFAGYLAFNFLCAFAPNLASLLVGRFVSGVFASSSLAIAPGVLVDMWPPYERGNAIALYAVMGLQGPAFGPVVSGFLELKKDWRWSFYVLLWMGGMTGALLLTFPETYPPVILAHKTRRLIASGIPEYQGLVDPITAQGTTVLGNLKIALTRPWRIFIDPISLLIAAYISTVYTLQYMLFTIYPIVFRQQRGWNAGVSELPLIGTAVGGCIGALIIYATSVRDQRRRGTGEERRPEDRLPVAMVGAVLFPISMFWFAWSAAFVSVHWIVPTVAGVSLMLGMMLIFVPHLNYLTDTYLTYSASAVAANVVCRAICGAAAPLFTQYQFDALGVGGAGSLIGGLGVLLAPIPFVFYRYGPAIRARSKFASSQVTTRVSDQTMENEPGHQLDKALADSAASTTGGATIEAGFVVREHKEAK